MRGPIVTDLIEPSDPIVDIYCRDAFWAKLGMMEPYEMEYV